MNQNIIYVARAEEDCWNGIVLFPKYFQTETAALKYVKKTAGRNGPASPSGLFS